MGLPKKIIRGAEGVAGSIMMFGSAAGAVSDMHELWILQPEKDNGLSKFGSLFTEAWHSMWSIFVERQDLAELTLQEQTASRMVGYIAFAGLGFAMAKNALDHYE